VLLDIRMPGLDGIALAQTIAALPQPPAVVFVTAHSEHAVQAFEVEAMDYLTKPVRLERLQQALQKVERLAQSQRVLRTDLPDEMLIIQDRGRTERVRLAEVLYLKAELKYITVRTASRSYILDGSLSEMEERHAAQFMRIHRNALIARRAIRALEKHFDPEEGEGWAVRLNGIDEVLAVSRRQLSAVREAIAG
jgi:two-component system response regulator AlgR